MYRLTPGRGTPIYKLYGYVPHIRVWFSSCFSQIDMVFAFLVWNRVWLQIYGYRLSGSGLKRGLKNHIFWSEIGSGFWEPCGTPPPKILKSTPRGLTSEERNVSLLYLLSLSFIGDLGFFVFSDLSRNLFLRERRSEKRKKPKSPINDKGQQMEQRYVYFLLC